MKRFIVLIVFYVSVSGCIKDYFLDDFIGQVFALYVLTVAAAESAVGLAILVIYYRIQNTLAINSINLLHG